jgi:hypothetical protein
MKVYPLFCKSSNPFVADFSITALSITAGLIFQPTRELSRKIPDKKIRMVDRILFFIF